MKAADKVVLITGSGKRIGAEVAVALHDEGMKVLLHCRRSITEVEKIASSLNAKRVNSAHVIQADLLQPSDLRKLASEAIVRWGGVDVLINNASAFYPTPMMRTTEQEWDEMLGVHVKAPFFLTQCIADKLKERRGCIVNITDIYTDRPLQGYPAYSVAKAGLAALTKALACELAPQVRCNAVAPGAILWPEYEAYAQTHREVIARTALKREGSPRDIARAVIFLICDADYITGQTIVADGGRTLSN